MMLLYKARRLEELASEAPNVAQEAQHCSDMAAGIAFAHQTGGVPPMNVSIDEALKCADERILKLENEAHVFNTRQNSYT